MSEFEVPDAGNQNSEKDSFQWLYVNGLLGVIFTFGLLITALKSRGARSWRYGTGYIYEGIISLDDFFIANVSLLSDVSFPSIVGWCRSLIADYGVPLMVVAWSAMSFIVPGKVPSGVPRRLVSPLPWESASLEHWTVMKVK